jgi:hypothetical protein
MNQQLETEETAQIYMGRDHIGRQFFQIVNGIISRQKYYGDNKEIITALSPSMAKIHNYQILNGAYVSRKNGTAKVETALPVSVQEELAVMNLLQTHIPRIGGKK